MLNPKQTFVVSQIPRWQISEELNTFLGLEEFRKSDDRLSDELCRKYAAGIGKSFGETADEEECAADEMRMKFIKKNFPECCRFESCRGYQKEIFMKPSDRKAWILSWLTRWPPTVNSLDEAFVDAYIGYTGATFEPKNWGAHWCKQLSNDLRKMFLAGVLVRKRISLGSNWQPGFPTWCWAYEKPPRYPVTEGRDQSRWMAFPPNYKQEPCCPTCNGPRDSDGSRIHEADCQIAKDEGLLRRD